MRDISKLKALLDISAEDESRDELLSFHQQPSGVIFDFRQGIQIMLVLCSRGTAGDELECVAVEMAAQDYGALGGEGISSRSLSGISEHYRPDYSEKIKAVLRRARKPGVIS